MGRVDIETTQRYMGKAPVEDDALAYTACVCLSVTPAVGYRPDRRALRSCWYLAFFRKRNSTAAIQATTIPTTFETDTSRIAATSSPHPTAVSSQNQDGVGALMLNPPIGRLDV
jgi:hypothetical protein